MAKWQHTLNVKNEWEKAEKGEISVAELSKSVAHKLERINRKKQNDPVLETLIDDFYMLAEDKEAETQEFDWIWNDLYNWADQEVPPFGKRPQNRMCWVKTF